MNEKQKQLIDSYVQEVSKYLPYPFEDKEQVLTDLSLDLEEIIQENPNTNPTLAFGSPRDAALNISRSRDWSYPLASGNRRACAFAVDLALQTVTILLGVLFILGLVILFISSQQGDPDFPTFLFMVLFVVPSQFILGLLVVLYPMVSEGLYSTTLGKRLFGLVVVDKSGITISWTQAFVRNLSKLGSWFVLLDLLIAFLQKDDSLRALDSVAETKVLRLK